MKQYPSINGPSKAPREFCHAFIKYDGSNLRFEYTSKKGWHLFGTRYKLFDQNSTWFGPAIPLFFDKYADSIEKIVKDKYFRGITKITAFCEFFGKLSFAGWHDEDDPKTLVLFDINTNKSGLLPPKIFLDYFGDLDIAELVYTGNLNDELITSVRSSEFNCESKFDIKTEVPEGIVCKGVLGKNRLWMSKIKTNAYFNAIRNRHPVNWQDFWE